MVVGEDVPRHYAILYELSSLYHSIWNGMSQQPPLVPYTGADTIPDFGSGCDGASRLHFV